jgi:hypothetical protein
MKWIEANLVPPPDVLAGEAYLLDIWKRIRHEFLGLIEEWETFREKRSRIEILFDIAKNTRGLKRLHQSTDRSVEKRVCRTFHLAFYLIHLAGGMEIGVRELVYWRRERGLNNLLHGCSKFKRSDMFKSRLP